MARKVGVHPDLKFKTGICKTGFGLEGYYVWKSFIFICLDIERIMENICDRRFWVSSTVVSGVSKSFVWIGFGWFPLKPGAAGGADGPPRGLGRALSGSGWRGETIFWKAKPF